MRNYSPRLEFITLLVLLAVFGAGLGLSYTFTERGQIYPQIISIIGIVVTGVELIIFGFQVLRVNKYVPAARAEYAEFWQSVKGVTPFVIALLFYFLLIYLIGLIIASGIWVALFLVIFGRVKPYQAVLGGLAIMGATFVVVELLTLRLPSALWDPFHIYRNEPWWPSF